MELQKNPKNCNLWKILWNKHDIISRWCLTPDFSLVPFPKWLQSSTRNLSFPNSFEIYPYLAVECDLGIIKSIVWMICELNGSSFVKEARTGVPTNKYASLCIHASLCMLCIWLCFDFSLYNVQTSIQGFIMYQASRLDVLFQTFFELQFYRIAFVSLISFFWDSTGCCLLNLLDELCCFCWCYDITIEVGAFSGWPWAQLSA